jgi:hypothetical protein
VVGIKNTGRCPADALTGTTYGCGKNRRKNTIQKHGNHNRYGKFARIHKHLTVVIFLFTSIFIYQRLWLIPGIAKPQSLLCAA